MLTRMLRNEPSHCWWKCKMVVLVYYKCSKLPKIDRQHILIIFQFLCQMFNMGFTRLRLKFWQGWASFMDFRENIFPAHSNVIKFSPKPQHWCSCFLLAVSWGRAGLGMGDWGWEGGNPYILEVSSILAHSSPQLLHLKTSKKELKARVAISLSVSAFPSIHEDPC